MSTREGSGNLVYSVSRACLIQGMSREAVGTESEEVSERKKCEN